MKATTLLTLVDTCAYVSYNSDQLKIINDICIEIAKHVDIYAKNDDNETAQDFICAYDLEEALQPFIEAIYKKTKADGTDDLEITS